jgi:glycosyltransferase involved in cell wall biosynthesis
VRPHKTTRYVNGKFLRQRLTGVERSAGNLLGALDARLSAEDGEWVLLHPPGVAVPALRRVAARPLGPPGLPGHAWEQLLLPRAARGGLLVNLSGSAPAFGVRQACLLHDAAVFDQPQAYTRAFVAWYRWLFRRLAGRAERLLTVSAFSQGRLAAVLARAPDDFTIVPNGADHLAGVSADLTALARFGLAPGRYLLAVASANPAKNLARLVASFDALGAGHGLRLVIVGGGNPRVFAGGPAAADPAGVVRTGPLPDAALKALYTHARALVFPSLYEGFGLPPVEAMACGCPVIASDTGAVAEVCAHAALPVDPLSGAALTAAMRRVAADDALCAQLREAGHRRAAGFTWDAAAGRLLEALRPLH